MECFAVKCVVWLLACIQDIFRGKECGVAVKKNTWHILL